MRDEKGKLLIFILEDSPLRIKKFLNFFNPNDFKVILAHNYDEGVKLFPLYKKYCLVLLDHDLGENSKSGFDFVKHHKDLLLKQPRIIIHSLNFPGAQNIINVIPHAIYMPFVGEAFLYDLEKKISST